MSSSSYAGRTHNGPQMARNCALCFDASASRSAVGVNIRFLLYVFDTSNYIYSRNTFYIGGICDDAADKKTDKANATEKGRCCRLTRSEKGNAPDAEY